MRRYLKPIFFFFTAPPEKRAPISAHHRDVTWLSHMHSHSTVTAQSHAQHSHSTVTRTDTSQSHAQHSHSTVTRTDAAQSHAQTQHSHTYSTVTRTDTAQSHAQHSHTHRHSTVTDTAVTRTGQRNMDHKMWHGEGGAGGSVPGENGAQK